MRRTQLNQKIKIGYKIHKPIITAEECELYSSMVEELSNHNTAAKPGEELWTVKEQENYYEVVSDGTVPSEEQSLEPIKNSKITESKTVLSEYLSTHPLQWTDGKYYSVTTEKQALLTSNLALYQISASAGQPFKLTWNSTGDECVEWVYEELAALALAIGTYVKPFVSRQQELELDIKACATMEELDAIEINYDLVLEQYLETVGSKEAAE